jgi:hypothetical protein
VSRVIDSKENLSAGENKILLANNAGLSLSSIATFLERIAIEDIFTPSCLIKRVTSFKIVSIASSIFSAGWISGFEPSGPTVYITGPLYKLEVNLETNVAELAAI